MNTLDAQIEQAFTRWQSGDRNALNTFIELVYEPVILPLARGVVREKCDQFTEFDLAQDTYQTLAHTQHPFNSPKAVYKYLKLSMVNDHKDHLRKQKKHESLNEILAEDTRS